MCGIKNTKLALGNTLATRRMAPTFSLILAMIADVWLDQVKFSLMLTPKNCVKETCPIVTELI